MFRKKKPTLNVPPIMGALELYPDNDTLQFPLSPRNIATIMLGLDLLIHENCNKFGAEVVSVGNVIRDTLDASKKEMK